MSGSGSTRCMDISSTELGNLLTKWLEEGASVGGWFEFNPLDSALPEVRVTFRGRITSVTPVVGFVLSWPDGDIAVSLIAAVAKYSEPREAAESVRGLAESNFVCSLSIFLLSGARCVIYEVKDTFDVNAR